MENKTTIVPPLTIHPLTLAEGDRIIAAEHATMGACLLCWCPRSGVGGVYFPAVSMWSIYSPISSAEFLGGLGGRNITVADSPDLQKWLDALSRAPSPPESMN